MHADRLAFTPQHRLPTSLDDASCRNSELSGALSDDRHGSWAVRPLDDAIIDLDEDRAEQTFAITTRLLGRPEQVGRITVAVHQVDPEPLSVRVSDTSDVWEVDEGTPWLTITHVDLEPVARPDEITVQLVRRIEAATAWSCERYVHSGGDGALACELSHRGYSVPQEFRSELAERLLGEGCADLIRKSDSRMGIDIDDHRMNRLVRSVADSLNSIARSNTDAILGAARERLDALPVPPDSGDDFDERVRFELGIGAFHVRGNVELIIRSGLPVDASDVLDGIGNWPLNGWARIRAFAVDADGKGGSTMHRYDLGPELLATIDMPLVLRTRTPRRPDAV